MFTMVAESTRKAVSAAAAVAIVSFGGLVMDQAYLAAADLRGPPVTRRVDQGGDLDPLFAAVGEADVDESGLADITSAAFTVTQGGAVVAAAGYRDWLGRAAHLSVLTAPAFRAGF
jgi:hypothetical protein